MNRFGFARQGGSLIADIAFKLGCRIGFLSTNKLWLRAIQQNWKAIEYFSLDWKDRIRVMAQYVPNESSVMDLGCGPMWLKELRPDLLYTGVDYTFRGAGSIVADFNRRQFPIGRCDVAFVSGCLEYVNDPKWLIAQVARAADRCLISYCAIDNHDNAVARRRAGWVNDLSIAEIKEVFRSHCFSLMTQDEQAGNTIFVFDRQESR